jgi:hypothetical protein
VSVPDNPWEDADTARQYAEFTRRFPMYRLTSEDIVGPAGPAPDDERVTWVPETAENLALAVTGGVDAVAATAAPTSEER